ncbi:signal recognition particle-docking protein FtsY, partial [Klebsiella pneumoniae]
ARRKHDPEAFAEDVVEVTETVVESEKAHLAEPAEEIPAVEPLLSRARRKHDPEAFAEDVVEVTETVVESEKAHLAEPA